ncbi:phosphonate-transporting ATPase [Lactobacillus selangorensis]|uniref:Phosphonate-transporting ATPase n=1 Tax=Lactobacillus selangorensis TaxID=81857 RepID=A0A0R2FUE7_9LACO|nr:ABC transporter ATP-binding protein/permease [Lactobacillus selangorensis]KRN28844.1 phosphonate-transporting ATPase [Lactobacillus selangorensis]KRN32746.1 phosphonate-transporting ATPase [Lactobacillus selangorensis]
MAYLELKDIHKSYYLNKEAFKVLKGINLKFDKGEFVSILGESGGGKSTLMNIIGGLDSNYEGDVLLNGKSLRNNTEKQWDQYRRQTIGFVFQNFNLISHLTLLENVKVSLEMTDLSAAQQTERAQELLTKVGLKDHMDKYPNQISGGQKQRVSIARALAADPDIIIADEPTGALDAQNTQEVLEILDGIAADGKLVITVTHSQEVANHGTRIVHMESGVIDSDKRIKQDFAVPAKEDKTGSHPFKFGAMVKMALSYMRYNLKRNLLIIFGAAIGIFSVVLMLGLGTGVKGYMNHEIYSNISPTELQITKKGKKTSDAQEEAQNMLKATVSDTDKNRIEKVAHVKTVEPGAYGSSATVQNGSKSSTLQMVESYNGTMLTKNITHGTKPGQNEILLTKAAAKKLTNGSLQNLVGKQVNFTMTVMGADHQPVQLTRHLTISGITKDQIPTLSYSTMKSLYKSQGLTLKPNFLTVKVDNMANVNAVKNSIKDFKTNGKARYTITGIGSMVDTLNTYISLAVYVLAAIAGISLLVSAIMIIVVLYISVSERTKEIGILRALGARKKDIQRLFISEAGLLGVFAGILGVGVAYLAQWGANSLAIPAIHFAIVSISWQFALFGIGISILISLLAALSPARRASKLDPIEALSYE